MHPAVLARAGLARKLRDQRTVGTLGEFVEESFHCRNVGEAMQALTVHAKFAGRLWSPQHQHCEEGRRPDVSLGCVEDWIAARFLIAARNERIQRERIVVGNVCSFSTRTPSTR